MNLAIDLASLFTSVSANLTEAEIMDRFPTATTVRTKSGGSISAVALLHSTALPEVEFEFDAKQHLIRVEWVGRYRNLDMAAPVYKSLGALMRQHLLHLPKNKAVLGSSRRRSSNSKTWKISIHDVLSVTMAQAYPNGIPRTLSILRTLRQPNAAKAACPSSALEDLFI